MPLNKAFLRRAVVAVIVLTVTPVRAFESGYELYEASLVTKEMALNRAAEGSSREYTLWVRFATYVDGFIGGLQFAKMLDENLVEICITKGEPLKAARDAVRNLLVLLSQAGDALNTDARMLVYLALVGRYPCN